MIEWEFLRLWTETFVEKFLEKIILSSSMEILSKKINGQEYAFNLLLSNRVFLPSLLFVGFALYQKEFIWALGAVLIMISVIIWCASFVSNELKYQRKEKNRD